MSGEIVVYDLGVQGVNVDKSPYLLADGELTKGQNAIPDPAGITGGLRKRPGLTKHNSSAVAAGSILGGIGAPIDPADSDGDPGDIIPPGQMQVTYWYRCPVASSLQGSPSFWYSLDGFLTSGNVLETGEPS